MDVGPARAGFTLVRTGGELPGPADGWLLQLAPDAARLLAPDDTVAYEGGLDQPPGWLDLVRRDNACVVLIATIGLYAHPGDEMTAQDLRRLLDQAAQAGELLGALVTAERTQVAGVQRPNQATEAVTDGDSSWSDVLIILTIREI